MNSLLILFFIVIYFLVLIGISFITGRKTDNNSFFIGNKQSPWYVVAFGMIGASLSGVTFISIPGAVGDNSFSYMQVVFGYFFGYLVIANLLMPLYYRLNLTSIYTYLQQRFGNSSYKTGASFFLLSRIIGASFRLYLVAIILQKFVCDHYNIPFAVTVAITIVLIWIYSFRAGIKTIVWTDTLQTLFMLIAAITSIILISSELGLDFSGMTAAVKNSSYSKLFIWDWQAPNYFFKHFFSGMFISIVMTGLDQDMMQKNLSCRNIKEAKKNMYWMSSSLIFVNIIFVSLGAMLYIYAHSKGLIVENFSDSGCQLKLLEGTDYICYPKDQLFAYLSFNHLPIGVGIVFILGLIAAAYSSADSALTSLTTSFCIDFLGFKSNTNRIKTRYLVHIAFSVILFMSIIIFRVINDDSVINTLFRAAGYTYGPLLGMYAFGLFTRRTVRDALVPVVAVISPIACYVLNIYSKELLWGYTFNFEILILNGLLTCAGLLLISKRNN